MSNQTSTTHTLKRLWQFIRPNKWQLFTSIVMSIAVSALTLYAMQLVGKSVDFILGCTTARHFWLNIVVLLALFAFTSAITFIQIYTMAIVGQRLANDLRQALFAKIPTLPMSYHDDHTTGDLMSRMTNDIDQINSSFSDNLTAVVEAIVNVIGTFVAMSLLSLKLTCWAAIVFPLFLILTGLVSRISKKLFGNYQRSLGALNSYIEEHLSAQSMLRLFNYKARNIAQFNERNAVVTDTYTLAQTSSVMAPMMNFINNLIFVVIAIVGGLSIVAGNALTVGTLFTFLLYMRRFATPLNQLASIYNAFQATVSASARIFSVLEAPDEEDTFATTRNQDFPEKHGITFDHLSFRYHNADTPALTDICATLPAKSTIAIVGATGAGKTTLTNLLLGFYIPTQGRILIDKTDLSTIPTDEIHRHIGVLPQHPMIFTASILENIAFGNPQASREEIIAACQKSGFARYVEALPDGYDTLLQDQGAMLSQGQRQLLAITRVLLNNNDILILDEATSSLDSYTEKTVQHALSQLMEEKTMLIIAHRLSTIKNADYIMVMKNGALLEFGSHEELLHTKGYYHKLYTSQF